MSDSINDWFDRLLAAAERESEAIDQAYQELENAGLINRVVVHRYICRKAGCKLATVISVGGRLVARTRDYKLAPNTNEHRSVPRARENNTLDGERHWPGHTFDVTELAHWGDQAGMDMNCRHGLRTVMANEIVNVAKERRPGHPGPPSRI